MKRIAILCSALALLSACGTQPISASLTHDIAAAAPTPKVNSTISQGLIDASFNLDQAVAVGALDKTDAAPACLHSVLTQLGIDPSNPSTPAANFTPRESDLISAASVAYIRARQAERLQKTGFSVDMSCKALIGQIVIDAGKAAARGAASTVPGLGLLLPQ